MGGGDAAQDQGPDPGRVAHADQGLAGHGDQGLGAFPLLAGVAEALDDRRTLPGGEQVDARSGARVRVVQAAGVN